MTSKRWLGRRGLSMVLALPSLAINYLSVTVLQGLLNTTHLWVLSIIAIGDIIGYVVYFLMLDWNIKMIQRWKD